MTAQELLNTLINIRDRGGNLEELEVVVADTQPALFGESYTVHAEVVEVNTDALETVLEIWA
jgi:hypothetical protein